MLMLVFSCSRMVENDSGIPFITFFDKGQCDRNRKREEILERDYSGSSLKAKLVARLNCDSKTPFLKVTKDTLRIDFDVYDTTATSCECFFVIDCEVKNLTSEPRVVMVSGRQVNSM